jgi:hypothetical protein
MTTAAIISSRNQIEIFLITLSSIYITIYNVFVVEHGVILYCIRVVFGKQRVGYRYSKKKIVFRELLRVFAAITVSIERRHIFIYYYYIRLIVTHARSGARRL